MHKTVYEYVEKTTYTAIGEVAYRTGDVITLVTASDAERFCVGMVLRTGPRFADLRLGVIVVTDTNSECGTVSVRGFVPSMTKGDWLFWSASEHTK